MKRPDRMSYRTPAAVWGLTIAAAIFLLPNKGTSSPEASPQQDRRVQENTQSPQENADPIEQKTPRSPAPARNPATNSAAANTPSKASNIKNFVRIDRGKIYEVTRGDLAVTIENRQGSVFSLTKVQLRTGVEGVVTLNQLRPGRRVKKGDLLFELANEQLRTAFREAQLNLETAIAAGKQARLDQQQLELEHKNKVQSAEDQLSLHQAQFETMKQRFNSGQATNTELLKGESLVNQTKRELVFLQDSLQLLTERAENSIHLRDFDRDRAALALQSIENQVAGLRIHSPIDGIVNESASSRLPVVGAFVPANTLLAELFAPEQLALRVGFPAARIPAISEGMPCQVVTHAGQQLEGTIQTIYPTVDTTLNMTVRVIVGISDQDAKEARLIPGARVSVIFYSEVIQNALTVPKSFLPRAKKFEAYKLSDGESSAKAVTLTRGRIGDGRVELIGDIEAGDRLFLHNSPDQSSPHHSHQLIKLLEE